VSGVSLHRCSSAPPLPSLVSSTLTLIQYAAAKQLSLGPNDTFSVVDAGGGTVVGATHTHAYMSGCTAP
jgi:hypothetical protein